ncbi:RES family NAD+ phosphorylase [Geotalea toluenoxydans]|uniref:RES family NAD+ phosphorylase n=1 Tax=Geotalea toluenoxydans TaxID=421624 RepID=UPI001FB32611|nr:RES family NAD+ phosphorylase [Geotalea toluenoxydans]
MSFITWTPDAVSSNSRRWSESLWRMVEAQHMASTMKLVDTLAEQDILEQILEESKPPLPRDAAILDYLLAAPFRYIPYPSGSRFRAPTDPGVFYGAETIRTAAAEIGYWRWKFLQETTGLQRLGPAAHTAFSVTIDANAIDLRLPPFDQDAAIWTHPTDYTGTQALARLARETGVEAIFYRSVRDPDPAWCAALLTPRAFASNHHDPVTQTWQLIVTRDEAIWRREMGESFSFGFVGKN